MAWPSPSPTLLLSTLFLTGILSGCVGDEAPLAVRPGPGPFADPMAFTEGHDHAAHAQHDLSWNMSALGWSELVPGKSVAWGELDIKEHHGRDVAVVAFAWPTAGFATVDVTDPTNLTLLDHVDLGYGYGADVKWLDSGDFAVLAVQTHSQRGLPAPLTDPLAATVENGLAVFHITEEGVIHTIGANTPGPTGGIHMVYTHVIDGSEYIFAAYNSAGVVVYRFDWQDPPVGAVLVPVNAVVFMDEFGPVGAHDMTVIEDPILDKPLLWVAAGYEGLYVFDVSDPEHPLWPDMPLGMWSDPDNTWYMHTVQATVVGDRRFVALVPEVFSENEIEVVAPLWILDATDLADMQVAATWKNPGDHGAEQLRFSVHNLQLVGDKIALAHYHGGAWLLDAVDDTGHIDLTTAGYLLPANVPSYDKSGIYHGVYNMEDGPTVWDVVVHKGVLFASDVNSGLYALQTPAWTPGDATATSIG